MTYIKVDYVVGNTIYTINKLLRGLSKLPVVSFDCETRSIYTAEEIKEAKDLLKNPELVDPDQLIHIKQVAKSSGLSNPRIILTTHFIFGITESESVILVSHDRNTELMLWNWLVAYKGKLLIHNTGFDLKICYQRTGQFPVDYEDTQLLAKSYINNAENWKAKVGLKVLMGSFYNPKWGMFEDYQVRNLNDKDFLDYCAIDGCAVILLWNQLQEYVE